VFTFEQVAGTNPASWGWQRRGKPVLDKEYLARQTLTLLKFAKSTKDPNISAALVDKAADLKSRIDEIVPPPDLSHHASDVEPAN